MLWMFEAALTDLEATLPTWKSALPDPEPEARERLNPFTGQRETFLTYNPDPDADFEEPEWDEGPPPFPHAWIWDPGPGLGVPALFELVTGDVAQRPLTLGDLVDARRPIYRVFQREILCGSADGPRVFHLPLGFAQALAANGSAITGSEWTARVVAIANGMGARVQGDPAAQIPAAQQSLEALAQLVESSAGPWLVWEDPFDAHGFFSWPDPPNRPRPDPYGG